LPVTARHDKPQAQVGWEHFTHDADIGVSGHGGTPEEAFEQAALALTAIATDVEVEPRTRVEVTCRRPDLELLFVDWLDAVIYEMAVRNMLFGRFKVHIEGTALTGELWGEPVDVARHTPACEPKGATLTALKVSRDSSGVWTARCVVDV
jgi:tRNA nucleotidyltransferase (CCA-adding enzyme)